MVKIREKNESLNFSERIIQLQQELQDFWLARQAEVNDQWKRTLPFADYVVGRWEKARILGFGYGSSIYDSSVIIGDVKVGEHTWIGPFTLLDGSGGLTIGSFCSISTGVQIYTHDTVKWALSGGKIEAEQRPTKIGSKSYIGPNTIISMGVTIGDGCVIGANSLVIKDVPPGSKAYGNPCKVTGKVDLEKI